MKPVFCKFCEVKYKQRYDGHHAMGNPQAEVAEHQKWCKCWHCDEFHDPETGHFGECSGNQEVDCERYRANKVLLQLTADREAAHKVYMRTLKRSLNDVLADEVDE